MSLGFTLSNSLSCSIHGACKVFWCRATCPAQSCGLPHTALVLWSRQQQQLQPARQQAGRATAGQRHWHQWRQANTTACQWVPDGHPEHVWRGGHTRYRTGLCCAGGLICSQLSCTGGVQLVSLQSFENRLKACLEALSCLKGPQLPVGPTQSPACNGATALL